MTKSEAIIKKHPYFRRCLEVGMVLFLALYPLRHIHIGLDLWDTGYNYANFEFMGRESMDPMWYFSTYLSTALGHLMTILPFGKTLLAMNFYTSLVVSLLAVSAYLFCTRIVKIPRIITFLGEYIAISLCWCPTALLYNYLTYLLMLLAVMCLYVGLIRDRKTYLFIAGIMLGLNVFVRFSNLPECAFIVGVWAFGHLEVAEKLKKDPGVIKKRERKLGFKKTMLRTLVCILGYGFAVAGMLIFFGIKYGFREYVNAITRLFAMTADASDYKATSMLTAIAGWYIESFYWLSRLFIFAIGGIILCIAAKFLDNQLGLKENGKYGPFGRNFNMLQIAYVLSCVFAAGSIAWLYKKKFCFGYYGEYGSVMMPGAVMTLITVVITLILVFRRQSTLEDRLMAGLAFLIVLITPMGSNNGIFPVVNNLFLVSPVIINYIWKLVKVKEWEGISKYNFNNPIKDKNGMKKSVYQIVKSYLSLFPIKAGLLAFCLLFLVQTTTFGMEFTFTEAKNAKDTFYTVESNPTLHGIRMSFEKAYDMYGLTEYANAHGLKGKELITYGYIPAVSFYLQMPSAFNPWVDLASYNIAVMEEEINKITADFESGVIAELPVIIIDSKYMDCATEELAEANGIKLDDDKWKLIMELIVEGRYSIKYHNSSFAVLEANAVAENM